MQTLADQALDMPSDPHFNKKHGASQLELPAAEARFEIMTIALCTARVHKSCRRGRSGRHPRQRKSDRMQTEIQNTSTTPMLQMPTYLASMH